MSGKATMWLTWDFRPFHRRYQPVGAPPRWWLFPLYPVAIASRLILWAWPVRWLVVHEQAGMTTTDYFTSASAAAAFMCETVVKASKRYALNLEDE